MSRRHGCIAVLVLVLTACGGESTGLDPDDTTPRFEFSEFRVSPDSGCGIENIQFSVLADLRPARDIFFELTSGEATVESGLLKSTLFTNGGGRVLIVNKQARRIRERVGYGQHQISITFRETTGDERTAGPLTVGYEAEDCS